MADQEKSSSDSKVFDVAKPAKAAASTSTKSASIQKRSMMTSAPSDSGTPEEEKSIDTPDTKSAPVSPGAISKTSSGKLKIEPISKPEDLKPAEEEKADDTSESENTDDTEDTTENSFSQDGNTEPNSRDALKNASRDEQEVVDSKAAERQANYDKIVNAKTYFLPINQVVRRRSKHVAIAGIILIVLLGLAWLDVSLDAGLISIPGIDAPTHFFK